MFANKNANENVHVDRKNVSGKNMLKIFGNKKVFWERWKMRSCDTDWNKTLKAIFFVVSKMNKANSKITQNWFFVWWWKNKELSFSFGFDFD